MNSRGVQCNQSYNTVTTVELHDKKNKQVYINNLTIQDCFWPWLNKSPPASYPVNQLDTRGGGAIQTPCLGSFMDPKLILSIGPCCHDIISYIYYIYRSVWLFDH